MRNNDRGTPRQNNDINNHIEVNHENSRDVANETHFHYLKNILPETPHNIHIRHALRQYRDEMSQRILHENPYNASTESYNNNKISLRFLLKQLSSSECLYFKQMSDLLYTLPFKFDDLDAQTSDINDIIRIIREDKVTNSYSILK